MKVAVIDVGSNSVRLLLSHTGERRLITARLGEGVCDGLLGDEPMERTVKAISCLKDYALSAGADVVYTFATEAVRRAKNGCDFVYSVKKRLGISICVVDGDTEADLALTGALGDADGCVIDLGGASTEIAIRSGGRKVYSHSLPVGAVVLSDVCGRDKNKLTAYITQKVQEYGQIPPQTNVVAVGGTATSLGACELKLKDYDAALVDGTVLSVEDLFHLADVFDGKSPEEILSIYPTVGKRAEIILGGTLLLAHAIQKTGATHFTLSESDNLQGFLRYVQEGKIKAEGLSLQ